MAKGCRATKRHIRNYCAYQYLLFTRLFCRFSRDSSSLPEYKYVGVSLFTLVDFRLVRHGTARHGTASVQDFAGLWIGRFSRLAPFSYFLIYCFTVLLYSSIIVSSRLTDIIWIPYKGGASQAGVFCGDLASRDVPQMLVTLLLLGGSRLEHFWYFNISTMGRSVYETYFSKTAKAMYQHLNLQPYSFDKKLLLILLLSLEHNIFQALQIYTVGQTGYCLTWWLG